MARRFWQPTPLQGKCWGLFAGEQPAVCVEVEEILEKLRLDLEESIPADFRIPLSSRTSQVHDQRITTR